MTNFLGEFRDVLARGDDLPTLPTVALELHRVLDNEHVGAFDVARIIERDPALATRLLRLANSAAFNRGSPVGSVSHAVQMIGLKHVGTLCLALSVVNAFSSRRGGLGHRSFWQHCAGVAFVTRDLARHIGYRDVAPEQMYIGGLLHDVGLLLLDQFFPTYLQQSIAEAYSQACPLNVAEEQILGTDHGEVGGLLLGRWSLPEPIVAMVSSHHQPAGGSRQYRDACWIVYCAEMICCQHGPTLSLEGLNAERASFVVTSLTAQYDVASILDDLNTSALDFVGDGRQ